MFQSVLQVAQFHLILLVMLSGGWAHLRFAVFGSGMSCSWQKANGVLDMDQSKTCWLQLLHCIVVGRANEPHSKPG